MYITLTQNRSAGRNETSCTCNPYLIIAPTSFSLAWRACDFVPADNAQPQSSRSADLQRKSLWSSLFSLRRWRSSARCGQCFDDRPQFLFIADHTVFRDTDTLCPSPTTVVHGGGSKSSFLKIVFVLRMLHSCSVKGCTMSTSKREQHEAFQGFQDAPKTAHYCSGSERRRDHGLCIKSRCRHTSAFCCLVVAFRYVIPGRRPFWGSQAGALHP